MRYTAQIVVHYNVLLCMSLLAYSALPCIRVYCSAIALEG